MLHLTDFRVDMFKMCYHNPIHCLLFLTIFQSGSIWNKISSIYPCHQIWLITNNMKHLWQQTLGKLWWWSQLMNSPVLINTLFPFETGSNSETRHVENPDSGTGIVHVHVLIHSHYVLGVAQREKEMTLTEICKICY